MLTMLQRRPWRPVRLARDLADSALRIHRVQAPPDLPDLLEVLAERIAGVDLELRLRKFALHILETLPAGDRLCHGDFHPGNAVVTADGTSIIDWVAAVRLAINGADSHVDGPHAFARVFARSYRSQAQMAVLDVDRWMVVHAAARLAEGIPDERMRLVGVLENAYRSTAARA